MKPRKLFQVRLKIFQWAWPSCYGQRRALYPLLQVAVNLCEVERLRRSWSRTKPDTIWTGTRSPRQHAPKSWHKRCGHLNISIFGLLAFCKKTLICRPGHPLLGGGYWSFLFLPATSLLLDLAPFKGFWGWHGAFQSNTGTMPLVLLSALHSLVCLARRRAPGTLGPTEIFGGFCLNDFWKFWAKIWLPKRFQKEIHLVN